MIQKDEDEIEGKKECENKVMRAVMNTQIDGEWLILVLHDTYDTDITWKNIKKKVKGRPMRKTDKCPGNVTFFKDEICTYVDDNKMIRLVDLEKYNAYSIPFTSVTVNNIISDWK